MTAALPLGSRSDLLHPVPPHGCPPHAWGLSTCLDVVKRDAHPPHGSHSTVPVCYPCLGFEQEAVDGCEQLPECHQHAAVAQPLSILAAG